MSLVTEDEAAQRREAANLDPGEDADRSADAGAEHGARHRVEHRARGRPSLRTDTRGRGQVRTRPSGEMPPAVGLFNFDIDISTLTSHTS